MSKYELEETYSDDELNKMVGKVYKIRKLDKWYRNDEGLFAHTICTKCGREKDVFLSNLINDPDKYGSCICSDENIDAKIDYAQKLYTGGKKLSSNTSGYTGVSFVIFTVSIVLAILLCFTKCRISRISCSIDANSCL